MPNCDDPDGPTLQAVQEAVGPNDNFAMRQIRELGQLPPRARKALQAPKDAFRAVTKTACSGWVLALDMGQDLEERFARRRRKPDSHRLGLQELVRVAENSVEKGPLAGLQLAFPAGKH